MENYMGEIRMFAGNYAPQDWALCNGALLPISQNEALFTLLGTTYGGDGQATFALPDLRSRVPVHQGTGPSLPAVVLGQAAGAEKVTLTAQNLPVHSHTLNGIVATATTGTPTNMMMAITGRTVYVPNTITPPATALPTPVVMGAQSVTSTGNGLPVPIIQPYVAINFIIAIQGIYPTQN